MACTRARVSAAAAPAPRSRASAFCTRATARLASATSVRIRRLWSNCSRRSAAVVPSSASRGSSAGAIAGPWTEQVRRGGANPGIELMQRREVVEDPERAALGRDDQVLVVHPDVVDGHVRQVELERLPVPAIVEGEEHAELG